MKSPYIGNLVPNEIVTAQFLVVTKEVRQKKTGEPYLSLHLADRTGEVDAKMWDNVGEVMNTFDRDDFVKVKGVLQLLQSRTQFTIHRLRRLEEHEVQFSDFFPCSDRDPEEMFTELQLIISKIENPHLRRLLETVFADEQLAAKYKIAPAAKTIHHACRSGLIEHVLSLCGLCRLMASHYQSLDQDLLVAGAILHDIGKIEELSYTRSITYSPEGQLLGHIVIGLRIVAAKLDQLPDFPPKLRALLEHMIISHHGELEYGSPKVPVFPEALLLHHLDNVDSKMDAMRTALKRDRLIDGEFTGWVSSLERTLLRKDRFLHPAPARTHVAQEPQPAPPLAAHVPTPTPQQQRPTPHTPGLPTPALVPENRPVAHDHRTEHKPPVNTILGEKLQAVLESRK